MKNSSKCSDQLYTEIEKMKYDTHGNPTGLSSTQWIHLQDAVHRGTVSPLEAYECINIGYVADNLKIRESRYTHLL